MPVVIHIADYLAAKKAVQTVAVDEPLRVGVTLERGTLRVHRLRDLFQLWDLTNAGKRGRKVRTLSVSPAFRAGIDREEVMEQMARRLATLASFEVAELAVHGFLIEHPAALDVSDGELRGVDVTPGGFKPIKVETVRLSLEVGYRSFSVKDLNDPHNRPTCVPGDARKVLIPVFYRWVSDNITRLESMSYREVLREMMAMGIDYHDYCGN